MVQRTNDHCGNYDDEDDEDESPTNDDDKEMAGGRWFVECRTARKNKKTAP
jgi:hypothetical protein